jgi:hypothetical protein
LSIDRGAVVITATAITKDDFGGIWTHANEDCGLNTAPWTARPRSQLSSESGTRTLVCCVRGSYDNHLHQFGLVENVEIESTTSCMLSTRSTNWANPPFTKNMIRHNLWLSTYAESDQFLTQQTKFCIRGSSLYHLFQSFVLAFNIMGVTQQSDSAAWLSGMTINKKRSFMRRPGIEPRANAWKAFMLPLHHRRCWRTRLDSTSSCFDRESNTGPQDLQSCALPTELSKLIKLYPLEDIYCHLNWK